MTARSLGGSPFPEGGNVLVQPFVKGYLEVFEAGDDVGIGMKLLVMGAFLIEAALHIAIVAIGEVRIPCVNRGSDSLVVRPSPD